MALSQVLSEFPAVMLPADHLMELLPRMQPRYGMGDSTWMRGDGEWILIVMILVLTPALCS